MTDLRGVDNLLEKFFAWIKNHMVIATRYDKTARNVLVSINLAASIEDTPFLFPDKETLI